MLRLGGQTLAERVLQVAHDADSTPVLVLGPDAGVIVDVLRAECPALVRFVRVACLEESQVPAEMADSLRAGVRTAAESGAQTVAVLLVDQPGIQAEALRALLAAHAPGRITRALVDGKPTHPVIFDTVDAVAAAELAQGDEGARRYLRAHAERVHDIDLSSLATSENGHPLSIDPLDIDTPEDLDAARLRWDLAG